MSIRSFSVFILLCNGLLATARSKRSDCPARLRRSVTTTTGIGAIPVSSFTVTDLASFTAAQGTGDAAPPVPTAAYSANGGNYESYSEVPAFTTADFGDFFDTTTVASAAAATGQITGIGAQIISSFTVSDLASFTSAQSAGKDGVMSAMPASATGTAGGGATQTGIGAKIISSFTVTNLAEFTCRTTSAWASPAPTASSAPAGAQQTGIGAKVICSTTVGADVVSSAMSSLGSSMDSTSYGMPSASASGAPPATSTTFNFVPTTTGIGAKTLGFVTTTLASSNMPSSLATATMSASSANSMAAVSSSASTPMSASSTDAAPPPAAAATAAQANDNTAVSIPGQKLSVLPIGAATLCTFS